jgi:hypothetical protein
VLHSPVGSTIPLELTEKHFPLFLLGQRLEVTRAVVVLDIDRQRMLGEDGRPMSANLGLSFEGNTGVVRSLDLFTDDDEFGGMPAAAVQSTPETGAVLGSFKLSEDPLTINVTVADAGNFIPAAPSPADPSALDDGKLRDLYLYLEYRIHHGE